VSPLVTRSDNHLLPDPRRVISRQFLPGQELMADGRARVDAVITRVLAMPADLVTATLGATVALFADRHDDLDDVFARHVEPVAYRFRDRQVSPEQARLIGAYFTQEYALEAAALFNPSMVPHPDQSGLEPGELRYLMTVRSVGEGHVSSIQLRSGVLGVDQTVRPDPPAPHPRTGRQSPATMSEAFLHLALSDRAGIPPSENLATLLPTTIDAANLPEVLTSVQRDFIAHDRALEVTERIRWIFACDYHLDFAPDRELSEAVLFPAAPDESRGMEDARCTRLVEDDGSIRYLATYTAFDGRDICSHLIDTTDFRHLEVRQLLGPAAKNKGMAIFPRRVGGQYLALARWDRENIGITRSDDLRWWEAATTVQRPLHAWELIQLGNCGPPLETAAGWLVLTHGVGPVRRYGIGAVLLDLDDPTQLIGALTEPLLTPEEDERHGYVPNVVYSCGGLLHADSLVIPYGCSDSSIRFAFVDLPALLERLTSSSR